MKMIRNTVMLLAVLFPLFAHAVGESYTQEKFNAAHKAGKPTLVFIHAEWCPTCRTEERILRELLTGNEFKSIAALRVDFDTQKPAVKSFGVEYQSTLIIFKGGKEVSRITGETNRERIAEQLRKAL